MTEATASPPLPSLIQGASRGIGAELTRQLLERGQTVVATCRRPDRAPALDALRARFGERLTVVRMELTDESTIEAAAAEVTRRHPALGLLMNVAGLLHDGPRTPERRVSEIDPAWMQRVFAVNAFGPLLVAKHFAPLLRHGGRAVLANLSARVGSIGDDRLGGWYAYRGSKAAQNMFTKNLSIELTRNRPRLVVVALHPGTVATDLSAPFRRGVPDDRLFSVDRAARQLLRLVDEVTPEDNGKFFAWDGQTIPW